MDRRPVADIPGYYYDNDKQKYFKIQASSTAPSSSAYSSHDVKRRKTRDQRAEAREVIATRQKGRIRRSDLSQDFLYGGIVERALGRRVGINTAEIYAAGMVRQGHLRKIERFEYCGDPLFDVQVPTGLGSSMVDMTMVFDDQLSTIRLNPDIYTRSTKYDSLEICHCSRQETEDASWTHTRFGHTGDSTSLSSHQESRTLAMTWLSGTTHSGIAITPMVGGVGSEHEPEMPTIILGQGGNLNIDVHTSVAAPPGSSDLFAFGTSHGILSINKQFQPKTIAPNLVDWQNSPKDVFALEYLSDSPSILLSGNRRGILNLIDLRLPFNGTDTIQHPSTITHIRQLDTHRILVAGLRSNMCQYDLRFRKSNPPSRQSPENKRKPQSRAPHILQPTKSILTYPEYLNPEVIHHGLDVDLESGTIAVGIEDLTAASTVGLFSLHRGNRLKCKVSKVAAAYDYLPDDNRVSRCVKWVEDIPGKGKSLYVGVREEVWRYAWGSRSDSDSVDQDGMVATSTSS